MRIWRTCGYGPLIALALAACAARPGPQTAPASPYGILVVGYEARAKYGMASATAPEVMIGVVPAAVVAAATRFASGYRHDPRCNRFFVEGLRFLLLSRISCDPGRKIADGAVLTRIDGEGRVVGPTFGWISSAVLVEVQPYLRSTPDPRTSWRVGERVRIYRTQGGGGSVVPSADDAAPGSAPADPRDYDVDHYARVLRDTYAARLARALAPGDFAAVFASPDQLSLFAPSTAEMRPVLDTRPGLHAAVELDRDARGSTARFGSLPPPPENG